MAPQSLAASFTAKEGLPPLICVVQRVSCGTRDYKVDSILQELVLEDDLMAVSELLYSREALTHAILVVQWHYRGGRSCE